jgi:hypothetical protein
MTELAREFRQRYESGTLASASGFSALLRIQGLVTPGQSIEAAEMEGGLYATEYYAPASSGSCSGAVDGAGAPCALNAAGTACAVESGDCLYIRSALVSVQGDLLDEGSDARCSVGPYTTGNERVGVDTPIGGSRPFLKFGWRIHYWMPYAS